MAAVTGRSPCHNVVYDVDGSPLRRRGGAQASGPKEAHAADPGSPISGVGGAAEAWALDSDGELRWSPGDGGRLPQASDVAELLESLDQSDYMVTLAASTYRASRALLLAIAAAAAPAGSPQARAWSAGGPAEAEADQAARRLVGEALRRQIRAAAGDFEAAPEVEGAGLVLRLRRRPLWGDEGLAFGKGRSQEALPSVIGRPGAIEAAPTPVVPAGPDISGAAAAAERVSAALGALVARFGGSLPASAPPAPSPAEARAPGAGGSGSLSVPRSWEGVAAAPRSWLAAAVGLDRWKVAGEQPRTAAPPLADTQAPEDRVTAELLRGGATQVRLRDGLNDAERQQGAEELVAGTRQTQRVQLADIASPNSVAVEVPLGDFFPEPLNPVLAAWALGALALVVDAAMGGQTIFGRVLHSVELRGRRGCAVSLSRESNCVVA